MTTIRVPFNYTALVIEKRRRTAEPRRFDDWIDVEVREVSSEDAPVALRWHDEVPDELPFGERDSWGAFPSDGVCETRWLDGSHWKPVLLNEPRSGPAERMTAADLERLCAACDDGGNPLMLRYWSNGQGPLVEENFRQVEDCTRELEIAQILEKAENLVLIDGMVWQRTREPVCYLTTWVDYGHSYQAPIKMLPSDSPLIKDRTAAYRADRFDEACQAAIFVRGEREVDSVNLHRRVEVLVPESISYRDEEEALLAAAKTQIDRLASKPLKEVQPKVAAAWYALDAALRQEGLGLEERCEGVEEALSGLADAADANSGMLQDVARVLERWRSRPISMDEDAGALPGVRP